MSAEYPNEPIVVEIASLQNRYANSNRSQLIELFVSSIVGDAVAIHHNAYGAPMLKAKNQQSACDLIPNISISHSKNYLAVLLSNEGHPGVDIEQYQNRILHVAKRVFSCHEENLVEQIIAQKKVIEQHQESFRISLYTLLWSAKEAVYKALSSFIPSPDFLHHYCVVQIGDDAGVLRYTPPQGAQQELPFCYKATPNYMLVWCLSKKITD